MNIKSKKAISFTILLTPLMIILLLIFSPQVASIADTPQSTNYGQTIKQVSYLSNLEISQKLYLERLSNYIISSSLELYLASFARPCFDMSGNVFFYDQSKDINCLSSINLTSQEFTQTFLESFKQEFSSYESLLSSSHQRTTFDINEQFTEIIITSNFSEELIFLTHQKIIPINLDNELYFLKTIESNIGELAVDISTKLTQCTSLRSNTKDYCVKEITSMYLPKNLDLYDFSFDYQEIPNYFIVNVNVKEKSKGNDMISFSLKFEDIVPFFHIDFDLETYSLQDDLIKVTVTKPNEDPRKKLHGYILLYSYSNFFDDSYIGYDELLSLLSEKERIPNDFVDSSNPYQNFKSYELKRSSDSSSFDISLLFVPAGEDSANEDSFLIYQIYNKTTSKYELLEEGKTIYGYVFAVDTSFSYYIDEQYFSAGIRNETVSRVLPPKPLSLQNFRENNIPELTSGISFSLSGYGDDAFNSYAMYLCSTRIYRQTDLPSCENIISPSFSSNDGNFIFYDKFQDPLVLSKYQNYDLIPLTTELVLDEDFVLYILPQDSNQEFIFNKKNMLYDISEENDLYLLTRFPSNSKESILQPFFFEFRN